MRFVRNRKGQNDCGPIAIGNALKCAGKITSYSKAEKRIKKTCKWVGGLGVDNVDLFIACKKHFPNGKLVTVKSPKVLYKHLRKGGIFILSSGWMERDGTAKRHASFFCGIINHRGRDYYHAINIRKGETHSVVKMKGMEELIKESNKKEVEGCYAFLITKK